MLTTKTYQVFRSFPLSIRTKSTTANFKKSSFYKPLLGRYDHIPCELFRINNSRDVILREYTKQIELGRTSYDLRIQNDGLVHPRLGPMFEGPNGASVRPNGPFLQELVRVFEETNSVIYRLPEGTKLPPELVCLHEHTEHHSIQCAVPMALHQLNTKITEFFHKYGEEMTKSEFEERYPFI